MIALHTEKDARLLPEERLSIGREGNEIDTVLYSHGSVSTSSPKLDHTMDLDSRSMSSCYYMYYKSQLLVVQPQAAWQKKTER